MSTSLFGNSHIGKPYEIYTTLEIENDDGETEEIEVLRDDYTEYMFNGYVFTAEKNSNTATVNMFYYYRRPTSEYYWDYEYGETPYPIIPAIFLVDSSNTIKEVLNTDFPSISFDNKADGWYGVTVTLKRNITKGDRIFFSFIGAVMTIVHDSAGSSNADTAFTASLPDDHTFSYKELHTKLPPLLLNGSILSSIKPYSDADCRNSIYLTYENEPECQNYKVTVIGNMNAGTELKQKGCYIRNLNNEVQNNELIQRTAEYRKKTHDNFFVKTLTTRMAVICFETASLFRTTDVNTNNRVLKRLIETSKKLTSEIKSGMLFYRELPEHKSFTDEELRKLLIQRSGIGKILLAEKFSRLCSFKRLMETISDSVTALKRKSSLFRNTADDVLVKALAFAARTFYRLCNTVMSFWDYLKGKIRDNNNIVSLYCPVDLEIEIETHI